MEKKFADGGIVGLNAGGVPRILDTEYRLPLAQVERLERKLQGMIGGKSRGEVHIQNVIPVVADPLEAQQIANRILNSGMHNRHLARALGRSIEEMRIQINKACEAEAEVRKGDVLFLVPEGRVMVCRVQDSPALKTYVCTNGQRTFFVLESEIGSHQHYRDGMLVLDIVRALRMQLERH